MTPRNFLWVAVGAIALVLGVLVGGFVRTGRAQGPAEPKTVTCRADFPAMGLAEKERALVHTSWVDGDGDAVNVKVQFLDPRGQVLQEDTQALAPNETLTSKLGSNDREETSKSETSKQILFRAVVFVEPGSGESTFPADPGCPEVITSLERTTASGAGILVVSPSCAIGKICQKFPSPSPSTPPLVDALLVDTPRFVDAPPFVDAPAFPDAPAFVDAPLVRRR